LAAACSSTPQSSGTNAEQANAIKSNNDNSSATAQRVGNASASSTNMPDHAATAAQGVPTKRSVYFDFDRYALKPESKPIISEDAQYIRASKVHRIVIQGNTDERGDSEYNLALGQKRADTVRHSLALLGVPDSEMEAVSFGKEKPKAKGHDEAALAENRRADIVDGK
jgi:peptidoglycan-associated lipoprotein